MVNWNCKKCKKKHRSIKLGEVCYRCNDRTCCYILYGYRRYLCEHCIDIEKDKVDKLPLIQDLRNIVKEYAPYCRCGSYNIKKRTVFGKWKCYDCDHFDTCTI